MRLSWCASGDPCGPPVTSLCCGHHILLLITDFAETTAALALTLAPGRTCARAMSDDDVRPWTDGRLQ
jgi:hypothetical protein